VRAIHRVPVIQKKAAWALKWISSSGSFAQVRQRGAAGEGEGGEEGAVGKGRSWGVVSTAVCLPCCCLVAWHHPVTEQLTPSICSLGPFPLQRLLGFACVGHIPTDM
jgi:hypothetical protein